MSVSMEAYFCHGLKKGVIIKGNLTCLIIWSLYFRIQTVIYLFVLKNCEFLSHYIFEF